MATFDAMEAVDMVVLADLEEEGLKKDQKNNAGDLAKPALTAKSACGTTVKSACGTTAKLACDTTAKSACDTTPKSAAAKLACDKRAKSASDTTAKSACDTTAKSAAVKSTCDTTTIRTLVRKAPLSERDGEVFTLDFAAFPHFYFPPDSSPVRLEVGKHAPKCSRAEIVGLKIPGCFVIHNLLTKRECLDIVNALKGIDSFEATCIQVSFGCLLV